MGGTHSHKAAAGQKPVIGGAVKMCRRMSYMLIRTRMAETSRIRGQVKAGGKTYFATKSVIALADVSCGC